MAVSDAQRRATKKYIKKTYTYISCKIRKDKAEHFKAICEKTGTTQSAVFKAAIDEYLAKHAESIENIEKS